MSRPWNKSLRLRVASDQVEGTLHGGWPRGAQPVRAQRGVDQDAGSRTSDAGGHAEAIDAVLQDIAAQTPLKGVRLDVELASSLLHLDVVEGDFGALADRQLQGIADACVVEVLGDAGAEHDVRWHLQRDARHLVVVAIARAHLALLESVARSFGMRVRSVKPEFVVRWNDFGRAVKPGRCVFAVSTTGDLSIGAVVDGALASISTGPGVDIHEGIAAGAPTSPPVERVYSKPAASRLVTSSSGAGRGMFTPTRPMPVDGFDALDARVDRLLVCSGQDPEAQARFILVASDVPALAASSRWVVANAAGAPA